MTRALIAVGFCAVTVTAQTDRVRIHIAPPTSADGFVDDALKGQQDTVTDLTARLGKNKRLQVVVTKAEDADLTITVRGRGRVETGEASSRTVATPFGLSTRTSQDEAKEVAIVLCARSPHTATAEAEGKQPCQERVFTARSEQVFGAWKAIAGNLANQIDRWVTANQQALLAGR